MAKQIPDSVMWAMLLFWGIPLIVTVGTLGLMILMSQTCEEYWAHTWNWPYAKSNYRNLGMRKGH